MLTVITWAREGEAQITTQLQKNTSPACKPARFSVNTLQNASELFFVPPASMYANAFGGIILPNALPLLASDGFISQRALAYLPFCRAVGLRLFIYFP